MSTAKSSDTIPGNVTNSTLLVELRREHNELEAELKKIDSSLRRSGTSNIFQKSSSTTKSHRNSHDLETSGAPSNQQRGREQSEKNHKKRKNYDSNSDSRSGSSDDNTRSRPGSSRDRHSVKPAILSSVVRMPASLQDVSKQRTEALEVQKTDKKVLARNKRMFGMILGTLEKFQSEESHRLETTQKRSKIEKKLEIAVEEERALATEEREKLIASRQIKQEKLEKLDLKLDKVQRHENWELSHKNLGNFIKTDIKPSIFWLPRMHTVETEKKLRETRDYYKLYVAERRAKVKKELEFMDKDFQADNADQSVEMKIVTDRSTDDRDHILGEDGSREESAHSKQMETEEIVGEPNLAPSITGLEECKDSEFL